MVNLTVSTGALLLSSATLLIQSFAVVFPYWTASKNARSYEGLWQSCRETLCVDLPTSMLILIGVVVFISNIGQLGYGGTFHASFALCIVAGIGAIASGIVYVVWNNRSSVEEQGNDVVLSPVNN